MKSVLLTRLFLPLAFVLAMHALVQAQPSSGGPGPAPAAIETPIDGGVSLLLAGGAAYGFKRLRKRRAKK